MDERKILENLNVFQQVKSCSQPDNAGALVMFAKIMAGKLADSDISIERLAAIYQGVSKQIPCQPVTEHKPWSTWQCPLCGEGELDPDVDFYCPNCGQHLDWSV